MSTSKAPVNSVQQGPGPISTVNGARHGGTNLISVEPPKQSDLQVTISLTLLIVAVVRSCDA
jgi:hypothetical protein